MNAKKMIAAFAVLAMAIAAFAISSTDGISGDDEKYVEMKGDFTSQLTMTGDQTVVVVADLNIIEGGHLTIEGDFIVKEGVTVTIEGSSPTAGNSQLMILGNATIDGDIISKVAGGLSIQPGLNMPQGVYSVVINGNITALGDTSGTMAEEVIYFEPDKYYDDDYEIIVNGTVTVGTNTNAIIWCTIFTEKSKLIVLGDICGYVFFAGYAYIDGSIGEEYDLEMYLTSVNAVVDIVSVKNDYGNYLWVVDERMHVYTYGGCEYYINRIPHYASEGSKLAIGEDFTEIAENWIYLSDVTNIKVTEKVTTTIKHNEADSCNYMVAATEMIVSPLDSSKNVETVDGKLGCIYFHEGDTMFLESMTISDVALSVGYIGIHHSFEATLTIVGNVTFLLSDLTDEDSSLTQVFTLFDDYGELIVTGQLVIKKDDIKGAGVINAAHYTVKNDDNTVDNYYTTLQKAIDNGVKTIDMKGQLIVEKDLTVPEGVSLTTDPDLSTSPAKHAECAIFIKEGATLTIANGAQFDGKGDIDVEGAFVIENTNYGIKFNGKLIWADVQMKDGSYEMYTNICSAFAKADSGAELNAYNPVRGKIVIDKDLTIPSGMSFSNEGAVVYDDDGKMKGIEVGKEVTLTVAGKLIMNHPDKLTAASAFGTEPTAAYGGALAEYAVVKIGPQGLIQFDDADAAAISGETIYENKKIAGAYFNDSPKNADDMKLCIANIPLALAGILDANDNYVKIYGEAEISDLKVAGTEKERARVTFSQYADVTMKNFTFSYASITAEPEAKITGDIGTATGRMIFNDVEVYNPTVFTEKFLNDAMNLAVSGEVGSENATYVSGTVFVSDFEYNGEADLSSTSGKPITIDDNKFIVPAGSKLLVFGETADDITIIREAEFIIDGTVVVTNSGKLQADLLSVTGAFTVDKADGKSGEASMNIFIVGGTADCFEGIIPGTHSIGTASISGAGKFNNLDIATALVFNGADVSADVLADWMASDSTRSTQFYVEGSLWMTAFAGEIERVLIYQKSKDYYNFGPVLDNVAFKDWQVYDEKTKTYTDIDDIVSTDVYVGAPGYDKVYADIKKNIYTININADQGIDNIYIDGIIMKKAVVTNSYSAVVAAGTHTLSYTLANGYTGNAIIMTIDGAKIVGGGLSFVANDDKAGDDRILDITLSGIQKSGYDTDPDTHPEKAAGGLTVTEILLIVVVIIMAVMAVVLIMRLNRS